MLARHSGSSGIRQSRIGVVFESSDDLSNLTGFILCDVCGASTKEYKPKCTKHSHRLPYPRQVIREWQEKEHLDALAAADPATATVTSITAQDIVMTVTEQGPKTIVRLAKNLSVPVKTVKHYVEALARAGLVTTWASIRSDRDKSLGKTLVGPFRVEVR